MAIKMVVVVLTLEENDSLSSGVLLTNVLGHWKQKF